MELGKYDDAAESINKCLDLNPKHVPGLVAMGNLLFATGHSGKSQECHLKALEFNPKELTALIGLGNAYYDLNKIDDAISCYL
jgi:tetratricopeptide (TPR) repeat protein